MWSVTRAGPLLGQQGRVSVAWSGPSISLFSQSPSAAPEQGSICVSQKSAGLHKGPVISWRFSRLGPSQQALGCQPSTDKALFETQPCSQLLLPAMPVYMVKMSGCSQRGSL